MAREIRLRDTLTGALAPLEPREPGKVGIYACGPTVYGRVHVGNARPFVVFALLKRFLEHEGPTSRWSRTSRTSTTRSTRPRGRPATCRAPTSHAR